MLSAAKLDYYSSRGIYGLPDWTGVRESLIVHGTNLGLCIGYPVPKLASSDMMGLGDLSLHIVLLACMDLT